MTEAVSWPPGLQAWVHPEAWLWGWAAALSVGDPPAGLCYLQGHQAEVSKLSPGMQRVGGGLCLGSPSRLLPGSAPCTSLQPAVPASPGA